MSEPHLRSVFLRAMQDELDANVRKGDWDAFRFVDRDHAVELLTEHGSKLIMAIRGLQPAEKIREYAADVANMAAKIDECFGPPTPEGIIDRTRFMPKPEKR